MYRNKKRGLCLLLVFFTFIITGAVYAATTNSLFLSGTVTLESTAKLKLEYPSNDKVNVQSEHGSGTGNIVIAPDGQTARIEVTLKEPGDSITLYYNIFNAGLTNAKILVCATNRQPTSDGVFAYHLEGTHNAFNNPILAPFARIENCALTVEWESGVDNNANGTFTIELNINYEATTEPATVTSQ